MEECVAEEEVDPEEDDLFGVDELTGLSISTISSQSSMTPGLEDVPIFSRICSVLASSTSGYSSTTKTSERLDSLTASFSSSAATLSVDMSILSSSGIASSLILCFDGSPFTVSPSA